MKESIHMPKEPNHYVDNVLFYAELVKYAKTCSDLQIEFDDDEDDEDAILKMPQVPEYIATCFTQISNGLAKKANFMNYHYKEDMIAEAVWDCMKATRKFNPEKSKNPFAYYTQICYFAFIRVINKETKQDRLKYSIIKNSNAQGAYADWLKRNTHLDEIVVDEEVDKIFSSIEELENQDPDAKPKKKSPFGRKAAVPATDGKDKTEPVDQNSIENFMIDQQEK